MTDTDPETLLLVLVTYPENESPGADAFAEQLVERELAACVNVLDEVRSFFQWEGELQQADEVLLVAKTDRDTYDRLEAFVEERHPYDEPEVIAFSMSDGSSAYLDWVRECLE